MAAGFESPYTMNFDRVHYSGLEEGGHSGGVAGKFMQGWESLDLFDGLRGGAKSKAAGQISRQTKAKANARAKRLNSMSPAARENHVKARDARMKRLGTRAGAAERMKAGKAAYADKIERQVLEKMSPAEKGRMAVGERVREGVNTAYGKTKQGIHRIGGKVRGFTQGAARLSPSGPLRALAKNFQTGKTVVRHGLTVAGSSLSRSGQALGHTSMAQGLANTGKALKFGSRGVSVARTGVRVAGKAAPIVGAGLAAVEVGSNVHTTNRHLAANGIQSQDKAWSANVATSTIGAVDTASFGLTSAVAKKFGVNDLKQCGRDTTLAFSQANQTLREGKNSPVNRYAEWAMAKKSELGPEKEAALRESGQYTETFGSRAYYAASKDEEYKAWAENSGLWDRKKTNHPDQSKTMLGRNTERETERFESMGRQAVASTAPLPETQPLDKRDDRRRHADRERI